MTPAIAYYRPSPRLQNRFDEIKQEISANNGEVTSEIKDQILTFFLISHAIIEEHTAKLIYAEVIDDSAQNQEVLDYLIGDANPSMNQKHREDLLYRADVISGSLLSNLQEVRGTRNTLAHQYGRPLDWSDNLESKAETAVNAFDELHAICVNNDN